MRLTLIDPTLRDLEGHSFDYARIVAREALEAGASSVRIFAHSDFSAVSLPTAELGAEATAWFSSGLKDAPAATEQGRWRRTASGHPVFGPAARAVATLVRRAGLSPPPNEEAILLARADAAWPETDRLFRTHEWGHEDRIFLPNMVWPDASRLAWAIARNEAPTGDWRILLRFNPPSDTTGRNALAAAVSAAGDRIKWFSDTMQLAAAYSDVAGRRFDLAPIPVDLEAAAAALAAASVGAQPVRVGFFGEPREEKGFAALPRAIAEALMVDGQLQFTVQVLSPPAHRPKPISQAIAALNRMEGPQLRLLREPLDSPALLAEMVRCDVLLLPYRSEAYQLRSSGLLALAIALDRIVVAPEGENWLADQLCRQGGQTQHVLIDDIRDLAQGILDASGLASLRPRRRTPTPVVGQSQTRAPWRD